MKTAIVASVLCLFLVGGCVTQEALQKEMASVDRRYADMEQRISGLEGRVDEDQKAIGALQQTSMENETSMSQFSALAQEALLRAEAAEKLAVGTLLSEDVLSEERIPFAFNSAKLTDEAKANIDDVVRQLIEENQGVYIEVQGFTDSSGADAYNLKLGKKRARTVLRYIYETHRIPLHRMRAYSYGEANPLVPNDTIENRKLNRRVAIIVMK
jgi:outer membrane protein OmpA-like peptidoglycan-associated protein